MIRVGIVGGGAFGTALAEVAHAAGCIVRIWDRTPEVISRFNAQRENLHSISGTSCIEDVLQSDIVLLATSAQAIPQICELIKDKISPNAYIVLCSKGIHQESGRFFSEIISEALPENPLAVLSGPAFAVEIAAGLPTAVTIAGQSVQIGRWLASSLNSRRFRLYPSSDMIGVQLGGALKNVLAIASGITDGMQMGKNAQASLITRGTGEIASLGVAMGADRLTFMGLSGFGDIMLSCHSAKSRNYSLGYEIGKGHKFDPTQTRHAPLTEGVYTTLAVKKLADKFGIEMPVCLMVYRILYENFDINRVWDEFLLRPIKDEV